ncbi:MAG: response regulator [Planctomycetota bacterium]
MTASEPSRDRNPLGHAQARPTGYAATNPGVEHTQVYVVDDDPAVLESMGWLLEREGMTVTGFDRAESFLAQVGPDDRGCLVADLRLPGMSGLDLMEAMRQRGVRMPVIVITGHGEVSLAVRALKGGAEDFLEKPYEPKQLVDRVRQACRKDLVQHEDDLEYADAADRLANLTRREREVLDHVVEGTLNKQIAIELGISHKTVEVHRSNMMHKMGVGSVAELVRLVMRVEEGEDPGADRL